MSIRRLFCSRKRIEDGVFHISGDEAYHGIRVLRLSLGDKVRIFTEQESEFLCEVLSTGKNRIVARIQDKIEDSVEPKTRFSLIQGLPKAAKFEQIIVHGTELGLSELFPVTTERSVASGDKRERWRRLALEATKQSGRRAIPFVHPVSPLSDLDFDAFDGARKLLATTNPEGQTLSKILEQGEAVEQVVLAIGPEGGFTEEENRIFLARGFRAFTMGKRIMRTETASLAALATISYLLGEWESCTT